MTNVTHIQNWTGILQTANTNTDTWFWTLILYGVWLVILLILSLFGFEVAILASSFLGLIFGLLLVYAKLVSWEWCLTFVGLILFMILYISWTAKKQ